MDTLSHDADILQKVTRQNITQSLSSYPCYEGYAWLAVSRSASQSTDELSQT